MADGSGLSPKWGMGPLFILTCPYWRRSPLPNNRPLDVLLVEDDEECADLVVTAAEMGKINFHFKFATNGLEALDYLHRRGDFASATRPDIIFLDLNLPLVSGWEVLEDLKSDASLKNIPVVLLTTTNSHEDVK